jgi:multidrug efflux pump subunit AcrB
MMPSSSSNRFIGSTRRTPEIDRYFAVKQAIGNLFPAMIASSLSTIVIHFPFRLMSGLAGSFFRELSDTMQITMAASFLVTWLLLPVLHLMIGYKKRLRPRNLDTPQPDGKKTEETELKRVAWLTWLYRKPWVAVVFVLVLLSGGWLASTQMETGFLPDLDEGTIVLDYHSPSGTDIEETDRLCRQMETIIMANPNVETYSRRTALGMSFITAPEQLWRLSDTTEERLQNSPRPKSSVSCARTFLSKCP